LSHDIEGDLTHKPWEEEGEASKPSQKAREKKKAQSQAGSQVSRRSRVSKTTKTQDPLPGSSKPRIPSAASYKSAVEVNTSDEEDNNDKMELTPRPTFQRSEVLPPDFTSFESVIPLRKLLSPPPALHGSSSQNPREPRRKRQFGINVPAIRKSIQASKDTPMREAPEIWEPVTPAAPTSTPRKVKAKPVTAESVPEDVVTAEQFNTLTEQMNRTYYHMQEEFKHSRETLQSLMRESENTSSQLKGQLGLINAASQAFDQQQKGLQQLWEQLLQFKDEVVNEVSIHKSMIENHGITDSAIKTIKEVTKKSLTRWVENSLPRMVDGHVMNAMHANNLVDQETLAEVEGNLRKEVEGLDESIGEDLDGVQEAFEELREKIKSLKRKIAEGQCNCDGKKRRRLESE
jgi:peptidoglycan hydrolase CwlO-like protein